MRQQRGWVILGVIVGLLSVPATAGAEVVRRTEWVAVDLSGGLPADLLRPEGKTRWDLEGLTLKESWTRTIKMKDGSVTSLEQADAAVTARSASSSILIYTDPTAGHAAERWLLPDRDPRLLEVDPRVPIRIAEQGGRGTDELEIRTRRLGLGWVFLPGGPHEAVLQEALVLRKSPGERGFRPDVLIHRWIDPRAGVVAEVSGPASEDGVRRLEITSVSVVQEVLQGVVGLRLLPTDIRVPALTRVNYGFDRAGSPGATDPVPVSIIDPAGHLTIGGLIAAGSWDFSGNVAANAVSEIASTGTTVTPAETCNDFRCGFNLAGPAIQLGREDLNFADPLNAEITLSVTELEQRASDVTIWLRAGVRKEGISVGGLGESESRFCHTDELPAVDRTAVPLWRFPHQDAPGEPFYFQLGDSWPDISDENGGIFQCELTLFNHVCPQLTCGFGCQLWVSARDGFGGTQRSAVVAEGPVTLPSGHTFNTLVLRSVTEYCVSTSSNCGGFFGCVQSVRLVLHLFVAPVLGTVARLQSDLLVADETSFTVLDETDFKYGLFPPRSITVNNVGDTTIELSWDPGLVTDRIDGYRIYWDTDSGSDSAYTFDSLSNPGQAVIVGTTATISGLTPGTGYFLSVTALSTYANPATQVPINYESALFPITIPGSPAPVPAEVTALTSGGLCTPTAPVANVRMDRVGLQQVISWDPAVDPCLEGYQILRAASPESDANFSVEVPDTGLTTSATADFGSGYFIVVTKGSGGTGLWEHYGR